MKDNYLPTLCLRRRASEGYQSSTWTVARRGETLCGGYVSLLHVSEQNDDFKPFSEILTNSTRDLKEISNTARYIIGAMCYNRKHY